MAEQTSGHYEWEDGTEEILNHLLTSAYLIREMDMYGEEARETDAYKLDRTRLFAALSHVNKYIQKYMH